jgi:hypothetical protein
LAATAKAYAICGLRFGVVRRIPACQGRGAEAGNAEELPSVASVQPLAAIEGVRGQWSEAAKACVIDGSHKNTFARPIRLASTGS